MKNKKERKGDPNNISKMLEHIKKDIFSVFDFFIIMNDRLLSYRYKGRQVFPVSWYRVKTKRAPYYWKSAIYNEGGKKREVHGKTYLILLLLDYDIPKVRKILDYNCGLRGDDLTAVLSDVISMVHYTAIDVIRKNYDTVLGRYYSAVLKK